MNKNTDFKEHLLNLINALVNLSPSRNIISQIILLLPQSIEIIEHSYPESMLPNIKKVLESLGIEFGDKVRRSAESFAESLYRHIHATFDWLDDELICKEKPWEKMNEVRSSLAKLIGAHVDSIPNPYFEWSKLVLQKLLSKPGGDKVSEFLKMLLKRYERDWQEFLNEAKKKIKVNPAELQEILEFTVSMPYGSELIGVYTSTTGATYGYYLEHTRYHLDIILRRTSEWYTFSSYRCHVSYEIRHRETINKLLREIRYE